MDTNTIQAEITKIEPKKGDILLVRFEKNSNRQMLSEYMKTIKELLNKHNKYKGVGVIGVVGDISVEDISEKMMNQFGWFKKGREMKNG